MKTFIKITAFVLIGFGILAMILGAAAGVVSGMRVGDLPRLGGIVPAAIVGLLVGGGIFLQGLMLSAVGEVLYLLTQIAESKVGG